MCHAWCFLETLEETNCYTTHSSTDSYPRERFVKTQTLARVFLAIRSLGNHLPCYLIKNNSSVIQNATNSFIFPTIFSTLGTTDSIRATL